MDLLDRLLGHDEATTKALLTACAALPDEDMDRVFDVGWGSLRGILGHMIRNVEIWTDLMLGRPARIVPGQDSLPDLLRRFDLGYAEFAALARSVQAKGQFNDIWLDVLDRPPTQKTFGGAILHVITHNMHHRAGLMHILRRLGASGLPDGDLMGWETRLRSASTLPDGRTT